MADKIYDEQGNEMNFSGPEKAVEFLKTGQAYFDNGDKVDPNSDPNKYLTGIGLAAAPQPPATAGTGLGTDALKNQFAGPMTMPGIDIGAMEPPKSVTAPPGVTRVYQKPVAVPRAENAPIRAIEPDNTVASIEESAGEPAINVQKARAKGALAPLRHPMQAALIAVKSAAKGATGIGTTLEDIMIPGYEKLGFDVREAKKLNESVKSFTILSPEEQQLVDDAGAFGATPVELAYLAGSLAPFAVGGSATRAVVSKILGGVTEEVAAGSLPTVAKLLESRGVAKESVAKIVDIAREAINDPATFAAVEGTQDAVTTASQGVTQEDGTTRPATGGEIAASGIKGAGKGALMGGAFVAARPIGRLLASGAAEDAAEVLARDAGDAAKAEAVAKGLSEIEGQAAALKATGDKLVEESAKITINPIAQAAAQKTAAAAGMAAGTAVTGGSPEDVGKAAALGVLFPSGGEGRAIKEGAKLAKERVTGPDEKLPSLKDEMTESTAETVDDIEIPPVAGSRQTPRITHEDVQRKIIDDWKADPANAEILSKLNESEVQQLALSSAKIGTLNTRTDLPSLAARNSAIESSREDTEHDYLWTAHDVNRFKLFNDNVDHEFGDKVLQLVMPDVSDIYRSFGYDYYHISGDESGARLKIPKGQTEGVAENLRAIHSLIHEIKITLPDGRTLPLGMSMSVARDPHTADVGLNTMQDLPDVGRGGLYVDKGVEKEYRVGYIKGRDVLPIYQAEGLTRGVRNDPSRIVASWRADPKMSPILARMTEDEIRQLAESSMKEVKNEPVKRTDEASPAQVHGRENRGDVLESQGPDQRPPEGDGKRPPPEETVGKDDLSEALDRPGESGAVGKLEHFVPKMDTPEGEEVQKIFDQSRAAVKEKFKFRWRKAITNIFDAFVDVGGPWKRAVANNPLGPEVIRMHDLMRGAGAEASRVFEAAMNETVGKLSYLRLKAFADFRTSRSVVELDAHYDDLGKPRLLHEGGLTGEKAQKFLDGFKKSHPDVYAKFEEIDAKFQKAISEDPLNLLVDEGLIKPEFRDYLLTNFKHYDPRFFLKHIDPDGGRDVGGNKLTQASDSGIKKLDKGSLDEMLSNPIYAMGQILSRTFGRVFKNRAAKSLYNFVKANPGHKSGMKIQEAIHRTVTLDEARSLTDNLLGLKANLEARMKAGDLTRQQRLKIETALDEMDGKIDALDTDRDIEDTETQSLIADLQKAALDLRELAKTPEAPEGYEKRLSRLTARIDNLARGKKTAEIDAQIADLKRKQADLIAKRDEKPSGAEQNALQPKVDDVNKKIDAWAKRITDAEAAGEDAITLKSKSFPPEPTGFTRINSWEKGERQAVLMPDELAKTWVKQDPQVSEKVARFLGYASGTKLLKPLATGYNPAFALANIPRDIAHIWLSTQAYNKFMPVGFAQLAGDMIKVLPDVWFRKGRVEDYIKEGGGMDLLANQGQLKLEGWESETPLRRQIKSFAEVAGFLGETSELATRMALRERVLQNLSKDVAAGKITQQAANSQATHAARNYMDFAQGGAASKTADHVFPYFNAAIQGTRGLGRAFKIDPVGTSFKALQLVAFAIELDDYNRNANPEAYASISDREKATKFIFIPPVDLSYIDKSGEKRYIYLAIAKDQSQAVISAVGEEIYGLSLGDKSIDGARTGMALGGLTPVDADMISSVPIVGAYMALRQNKDLWANRDIWVRKGNSPKEEYYNTTSPLAVAAGQITNISPAKLEVAASKVFPTSNPFVKLVGAGANAGLRKATEPQSPLVQMLGKDFIETMQNLPEGKKNESSVAGKKAMVQLLADLPMTSKIVRQTYPTGVKKEALTEEATKLGIKEDPDAISVKELQEIVRQATSTKADAQIENDRKLEVLKTSSSPELRNWLQGIRKEDPDEFTRLRKRMVTKFPTPAQKEVKKELIGVRSDLSIAKSSTEKTEAGRRRIQSFNKLLAEARSAKDPAERRALLTQAGSMMKSSAAAIKKDAKKKIFSIRNKQ